MTREIQNKLDDAFNTIPASERGYYAGIVLMLTIVSVLLILAAFHG